MSMKIYTGVKFTTPHILDIHHLFMEWRTEIKALTKRDFSALAAKEAVHMIDMADYRGSNLPKSPLSKAIHDIWDAEKEIKATGRRNPKCDFSFSVSILPFEGQVYGIVYCEQPKWKAQFYEQPWVEEFGYWDNTDPEEGLTEEEWDERGRIWNGIFDQNPTPALCGLTAECEYNVAYPTIEEVMASIPSDEVRINKIARLKVGAEKMAEDKDEINSPQESMEQAMKAIWWANSKDGIERVAEVADTITVREITRELLCG